MTADDTPGRLSRCHARRLTAVGALVSGCLLAQFAIPAMATADGGAPDRPPQVAAQAAGPGNPPDDALANSRRLPAGVFGGVVRAPDGGTVVYLTTLTPAYEKLIARGDPASDFRFVKVALSYDDLMALERRVADDHDWFSSRGIELTRWGPDESANRLKIVVHGLTDHQRGLIEDRYGADRVYVTAGEPVATLGILATPQRSGASALTTFGMSIARWLAQAVLHPLEELLSRWV